ncbi:MAG: sialate O-acetylesterase [Saprospiraceae bacterium]
MKDYSTCLLICLLTHLFFVEIQAQIPIKPLLWVEASSGVVKNSSNQVSKWIDKNNNQLYFTQLIDSIQALFVPSSIGGQTSIRFNGSTNFMDGPSIFPTNSDYTIVVVSQAFGASANILGGTSRTLWMAGNTTPQILHNGDFNNQVKSSIDPNVEPSIIIAQYRNSSQRGIFYINSQFADSAYCPPNLDSSIYLSAYQKCCYFNGDISEILIYNRIISNQERITLENYLFNKYKISKPGVIDSTFSVIPKNYELIPRDTNNKADIKIAGTFNQINYDSIKLIVLKDNAPYSTETKLLQSKNGKISFNFSSSIDAGLHEFRLELSLIKQKKDSLIKVVDHIVCGDVFIITGQSNSIFGGTSENNNYCRTFGKNYSFNKKDTNWIIASAAGYGGGPDIGAWGMFMAKKLIETYKIPICIMNGGVGGTTIEQHQRNDINPYEPNSIYGSLNYRMLKSGLANAVKGIFWYQGESNSSNLYFENFKALYQDWILDYPNIKNVYVVQIHHGCGAGDHNKLREIQRKLPESFPIITLMSTMALPGHDGCHYLLTGYSELGNRMYSLVAKDFYKEQFTEEIYPPNIIKSFYTSKSHNEIAVLFDHCKLGLKIQSDSAIGRYNISLKDYFYLDNLSGKIEALQNHEDTLFLKLKQPYLAKTLSYLPEVNYIDTALVYEGPYLTNLKGIGALTFYNVPVEMEIISNNIDLINEFQISAFPNPIAQSKFKELHFNSSENLNNSRIEFYSLDGVLQYKGVLKSSQINTYTLSNTQELKNLAPGFIIYKIIGQKINKGGILSIAFQ